MILSWKWQGRVFLLLLVVSMLITHSEQRVPRKGFSKCKDHHYHSYNRTVAAILAQYASAVYMSDLDALISWTCSRCNGLTKSFEVRELIVDVKNCLQAVVGVARDLGSIVIAFRGTQENSIINWIDDLVFKSLDLNYPGLSGAKVHRGFYYAYHNTTLRPRVLQAVERIQITNKKLSTMVTGHSMGGAIAAFCALDLSVNYGMKDIQVVTFGQPRIGNAVFAKYYSEFLPMTIRVTHGNDIVPHLPPYCTIFPHWTYHHFPREVWIHNIGFDSLIYEIEEICDGSGEDPACSRSVLGNSITDHFEYYGMSMHTETWGECSWVLHNQQVINNVGVQVDIALPSNISTVVHANE